MEGLTRVFLSPTERQNIADWHEAHEDRTLSSLVLKRWWTFIASLIPPNVSPNVLTLCGLLCLLHGYYVSVRFMGEYPFFATLTSLVFIFAYQTLDAVDGMHARSIRNTSPAGELFTRFCDQVGTVFLVMTLAAVLGFENNLTIMYLTQVAQLVGFHQYLKGFKNGCSPHYSILTGPGELLFVMFGIMLGRAFFGLTTVWHWAEILAVHYLIPSLTQIVGLELPTMEYEEVYFFLLQAIWWLLYFFIILEAVLLPRKHSSTRKILILCLLYRFGASALRQLTWADPSVEVSHLDILFDSLFLAVLAGDLTVANMAQRQLHPFMAVFAMASCIDGFVALVLALYYWAAILVDITHYTSLRFFSQNIRVYVDGVFDCCHMGHKNHFRNAASLGTCLVVGVVSDTDAVDYKRQPIQTMPERMAEVLACKYVNEVVPNAPCHGIPESFIKKHNIHVVALSPEYDKPDDHYYATPRDMGITRVMPRTEGMSTSEIIRRVRLREARLQQE